MAVPYVDLVAQHRPLRDRLLAAVGEVLDHGHFILGPEVEELERRVAARLGVEHVVGVASGTDALVLALRLHGIGPGDEVVTVAHSFVATALAVRVVGATPVFTDIDEETMLLDPACLSEAVGPRTRAVIPVHLNGYPCDMDSISRFCTQHGLALIEDCAQAFGARYRGRSAGSFGTGCFSLHPLKVFSACGDAGFVTVSSSEEAARLRELRNLGLADRDHCVCVSGNSRLDTLHAAMLLVKLDHLDAALDARRAHAEAYRRELSGIVRLPPAGDDVEPTPSTFVVRHPRRDRVLCELRARGIEAKIHYPLAIHRQPAFTDLPIRDLPVTERVVGEMISLPVGAELSPARRADVIRAVREAVASAEVDTDEAEVSAG